MYFKRHVSKEDDTVLSPEEETAVEGFFKIQNFLFFILLIKH